MSNEKRAPSLYDDRKRYAVIVDAGSSGSRAHVYSWPDVELYELDPSLFTAVPQIQQVGDSKKISPGISKYSGDKLDDLWDDHLKKLMKHAQSLVPSHEHYRTPVFVLATAGMRLLPQKDQLEVLQKTCRHLREHTKFFLPECASHVTVIDGETEGLYGWLALNYLLGDGQAFSLDEQAKSYGFMDMGGASAQIAFAPNRTETDRHEDDLFRVNIRTNDGYNHEWKVFVSTWLGFGANEARNRFSEQLLTKAKSEDPETVTVTDPCLPLGAELIYEGSSDNSTVELVGSGNYNKCFANMYPLLQKELPCKDDPCLFNGVHVPAIDYNINRFVGVSEYWYTANDIMQMGGKYDFLKFSRKTEEFCGRSWSSIKDDSHYEGLSEDILRHACFKATWIINILHMGFGVPIASSRPEKRHIYSNDTTNDYDTQKQHLLELNSTDNNTVAFITESHDDRLSTRNIHDFLDPFQSAVEINGNDLSWTLGRAVLYASSLVAAAHDNIPSVGYLPVGESSSFIPGGELPSSRLPAYASAGGIAGMSSTALIIIFFIAALLFFVLYTLNSCGGKSHIYFAFYSIRSRIKNLVLRLTFPFRRRKRANDTQVTERLLEEGASEFELEEHYQLEPMQSHGQLTPRGLLRPSSSAQLATTTSMVDLKSLAPSRVNSRVSMRDSPPVSFLFDQDGELPGVVPERTIRKAYSVSRLPKSPKH